MKRNKEHTGGLFRLLAVHVVLFTLTLLAITAVVLVAWGAALANLYRLPDWDALLASDALREGNYDALRRYTGGSGDAAVYGGGTLLWSSADDFDAQPGEDALALVRPYEEDSAVEAYATESADGEPRTLVLRRTYAEDGTESVQAAALDGAHRVVWGSLGDGHTSYTQAEYEYLTDTRFDGGHLARADFTGADGKSYTVLLRETLPGEAEALRLYGLTRRIWLLFVPLYLADAGLFIWWLRRRIARPLRKLTDAGAAGTLVANRDRWNRYGATDAAASYTTASDGADPEKDTAADTADPSTPTERAEEAEAKGAAAYANASSALAELDTDDSSILNTPLFSFAQNPDASKTISYVNYLATLYEEIAENDRDHWPEGWADAEVTGVAGGVTELEYGDITRQALLDSLPATARLVLVSTTGEAAQALIDGGTVTRTYQAGLTAYEPEGDTVLLVGDTATLQALGEGNYTILRDYGDLFWDVRMNINDNTNNFTEDFVLPEAPTYGVGRSQ